MKRRIFPTVHFFCLWSLAAVMASGFNARAAVGLIVSPAVVTNDYLGTISLTVTGLSAGASVKVERFADLNKDGMISAGEFALQNFTLADGRLPLIGGIRNVNVPGDDDGVTNNQIQVNLPFPDQNAVRDRIVGNYLFRISSPTSDFAPVTNTFQIKAKTYPQGVSGQVTAGGGVVLSNAIVAMVDANQDNSASGVMTDSAGNFTIYSLPGDYILLAIQPGFVADQSAGFVTVNSNSIATRNVTNVVADRYLAGKIEDSATSDGLPAIMAEAESTNNLFMIAFTDAAGNFTIPVTAGEWKLKSSEDSGIAGLGYVHLDDKIVTNTFSGSVSNLNFQFPKATALIYGTVRDNLTNPVARIPLKAEDLSYTYRSSGNSLSTGQYSVGVFAGDWSIAPDNTALAALGFLGEGASVTVTNGQAVQQDFVLQHVTAHLRGHVYNNLGTLLTNIQLVVSLVSTGQSLTSLYPSTAGDGSFDIGVYAGNWSIGLSCGSSGSEGLVSPNLNFVVTDGVDQTNIAVICPLATAHISGVVRDNNGSPIMLNLYASATINGTNYLTCATADASGNYQFDVINGAWQVGISGDLTSRGYDNPANQNVNVSGNTTVNFTIYPSGTTPPTLSQASIQGGQFHLHLNGVPDRSYRIEAATNLGPSTVWIPLRTNTAFGGVFDFVDTNAPAFGRRYYRAVSVP